MKIGRILKGHDKDGKYHEECVRIWSRDILKINHNTGFKRFNKAIKDLGMTVDQDIIDFMAMPVDNTRRCKELEFRRTDPRTKPFYDMFNLGIPLEINHG
jgi:hypothetical protein